VPERVKCPNGVSKCLRRRVPGAGRAGARITERQGRNETCQVFSPRFIDKLQLFSSWEMCIVREVPWSQKDGK
jgi:hypothetical protein